MFLASDFPISGGYVETGVAQVFLKHPQSIPSITGAPDIPKTVSPCLSGLNEA